MTGISKSFDRVCEKFVITDLYKYQKKAILQIVERKTGVLKNCQPDLANPLYIKLCRLFVTQCVELLDIFLLFRSFAPYEMVIVMNLYSAFSINIFKCALQARDLWVRSELSIYRHISVHKRSHPAHE